MNSSAEDVLNNLSEYVRKKVVNEELQNVKNENKDLQSELQNAKTYILQLEDRIGTLESFKDKYIQDNLSIWSKINEMADSHGTLIKRL